MCASIPKPWISFFLLNLMDFTLFLFCPKPIYIILKCKLLYTLWAPCASCICMHPRQNRELFILNIYIYISEQRHILLSLQSYLLYTENFTPEGILINYSCLGSGICMTLYWLHLQSTFWVCLLGDPFRSKSLWILNWICTHSMETWPKEFSLFRPPTNLSRKERYYKQSSFQVKVEPRIRVHMDSRKFPI